MSFVDALRGMLYDPRVRGIEVDDSRLLELHRQVAREKPLLRSAFLAFYNDMIRLCEESLTIEGVELELGSGAGFFTDFRPELVTSDIRDAEYIDKTIDAMNMDIESDSLRCVYAINVFHHLPSPDKFFNELIRTLKPGGGCILVEPHNGFLSAFIHERLHTDEHFDTGADWETTDIEGPLSGANQALSYIVFDRDKQLFEERYGCQLEIVKTAYCLNGFRYLISGGVNFRQLLPGWLCPSVIWLENILSPVAKYWTLHRSIVIRKK